MFQEFAKPANFERENLERTITKIGYRSVVSSDPSKVDFSQGYGKYRELGSVFFNNWVESLHEATPDTLYPKAHQDKKDTSRVSVNYLDFKEDGVRHGFDVTGMLVGATVAAYLNWKKMGNKSVQELVDMQKSPLTIDSLVIKLADRPSEKTKRIEEALWLFNEGYNSISCSGYDGINVADQSDGGIGYFKPNLIKVIQQFGYEAISPGEDPSESCPAQRFIPILWTSMVDHCSQDSRFFEYDLTERQ